MRDRLIELLKDSPHLDVLFGGDDEYSKAADHLIAGGAVVLPCRCEKCVYFDPYKKVEDFDGFCYARDCETDKLDFCNYAEMEDEG